MPVPGIARQTKSALTMILIAGTMLGFTTDSSDAGRKRGSYGGNGGGAFTSYCPNDDALIGINMRAGAAVDAVVAICMPLTADHREWGGQAYEPTQYRGGGGGAYEKIACNPGDVVSGIQVSRGPWSDLTVVKRIAIQCSDLGSSHTYEVNPGNRFSTVKGNRWIICDQAPSIATGIYGNSGMLVDKIGITCME